MELAVTGLQKSFSSSEGEISFLLDLPELKFQLGSVNYIMGHNVSGKSVLIKLLCGELTSTNGTVKVNAGGNVRFPKELKACVVRQKAEENLCLDLSVEENLILRLSPKSLSESLFPKKYLKQKVDDSVA